MRRHREDGGSTSGGPPDPTFTIGDPPSPPPAATKSKSDSDPTVAIKVGEAPAGAPKELNAGVMRRGGRTRSAQ